MTEHVTDVVLDVDTGVDDALALLFAVRHPGLRVLAVSDGVVAAEIDVALDVDRDRYRELFLTTIGVTTGTP